MKTLLAILLTLTATSAQEPLSYNNRPLGSKAAPLIISTYLPDPGIPAEVFRNHHQGQPAPKYNPSIGRDVNGSESPILGIPAAIGVNFGPALSYAFDTTECRVLYAWQGGFIDFMPYWGDQERGSRISNDYVPRLVGTLFHKATSSHPLHVEGQSIAQSHPTYTGYRLIQGTPEFAFQTATHQFTLTLLPSATPLSFDAVVTSSPPANLSWQEGSFKTKGSGPGRLQFTFTSNNLGTHEGYKPKINLKKPSVTAGQTLFNQYGCAGCHSLDGSKGHGPTLAGLAGSQRPIEESDTPVLADHAYLLRSIREPNAHIAKGYPANYMPPFGLPDAEYESLILFIQSLAKPE